jgi:hypothetical protein
VRTRVRRRHVNWGDGTLTVNDWDQTGAQGWSRTATVYDAAGRLHWRRVARTNRNNSDTEWDSWTNTHGGMFSSGQPLGVTGPFDAGGAVSTLDGLRNDSDWVF